MSGKHAGVSHKRKKKHNKNEERDAAEGKRLHAGERRPETLASPSRTFRRGSVDRRRGVFEWGVGPIS